MVYVKICCCNFDSNTSQTCFQPSPVGDLVTIIRSSLPIQKHHLNDSKCWRLRLCIKSPHSPKPHVHPVKVYHGIRSFWNYLGANSGYFQQPPWRSLDHPINLPFSNLFRLERLNWSHQTHMNLHVSTRSHRSIKKCSLYRNSSRNKSSCWFPTDLNNVDQIGSSSPGCRDWFFLMFETTTNSTARHISGAFFVAPRLLHPLSSPLHGFTLPTNMRWRFGFFLVSFKVPFQFQNLNKTSQINMYSVFLSGSKKIPTCSSLRGSFGCSFLKAASKSPSMPWLACVDGLLGKLTASNRSKKCTNGVGFMNVPKIPSKCGGLLSKKIGDVKLNLSAHTFHDFSFC